MSRAIFGEHTPALTPKALEAAFRSHPRQKIIEHPTDARFLLRRKNFKD